MKDYSAPFSDTKFAALQGELKRGERILWKSDQKPKISRLGIGIWLLAIPWTAFALFWTAMAWFMTISMSDGMGAMDYAFPLFGVPFILIGIGMLAKPALQYMAAKRTVFAITNQRVIRLYQGKGIFSESIAGERIGSITRVDHTGGRSTLRFSLIAILDKDGPKGSRFVMQSIEDGEIAEKHLRVLAKKAKT